MKLAICIFGFLRTWKHTYDSFIKNVIEVNSKDGIKIDVFIHTWDYFEVTSEKVWHHSRNYYPNLNLKKVNQDDIKLLTNFYQPKGIIVDSYEQFGKLGRNYTIQKAKELRDKSLTNYDYTLYTRFDIFYIKQLKILTYFNWYKTKYMNNLTINGDFYFTSSNIFRRMPVADPRYVNEYDLIMFHNSLEIKDDPITNKRAQYIPIDYRLNTDFFIFRETDINKTFLPLVELDYSKCSNYLILNKVNHFVVSIAQSSISKWQTFADIMHLVSDKFVTDWAFHTTKEKTPYIILKLQNYITINTINVYNRKETNSRIRAKNLKCSLSKDGMYWVTIDDKYLCWNDEYTELKIIINFINFTKYIKLYLDDYEFFHLNKINIYSCFDYNEHDLL